MITSKVGNELSEWTSQPGELTALLRAWSGGDNYAFSDLIEVVYPRLRSLAGAIVARGWGPEAPQRTVLVHELYLKLQNQRLSDWKDREHFFTYAAKAMRWIVIDQARASGAGKRRQDGMPIIPELPWIDHQRDLLDLDRALERLEAENPRLTRVVEMRCFLGMTAEETAAALRISKPTVDRDLAFARAWLHRQLRRNNA